MSTDPSTLVGLPEPWVAFRKDLGASVLRQQAVYDETVLKLAAGGLGLAVTLAQVKPGETRWPLLLATIALAASISAVLLSFVTSQIESKRRIALIDANDLAAVQAGKTTWKTQLLNYGSGSLLALAAIFFALFVALNI